VAEQLDAVQVLTRDHRDVEELFQRFESTTDPDDKTRIAHEVIHDLAVHGEIEELLFYPRLRTLLDDGNTLAEEAIHEHVEIKQTLNDLDKMTAADDGFDDKMRALMAEVRHHVEEEERDIFPKIREALPADELATLGHSLDAVRKVVPTRPHPHAPTGPIGKLVTSPPVALIDRVRDAIRAWRDDAKS
jgi:hemerythrin superfamily protein